jgi:hypothetical protein
MQPLNTFLPFQQGLFITWHVTLTQLLRLAYNRLAVLLAQISQFRTLFPGQQLVSAPRLDIRKAIILNVAHINFGSITEPHALQARQYLPLRILIIA